MHDVSQRPLRVFIKDVINIGVRGDLPNMTIGDDLLYDLLYNNTIGYVGISKS